MFAPGFGVASLFLSESVGPLGEGPAGLRTFAEFGEPEVVGFHESGSRFEDMNCFEACKWGENKVRSPR